MSKELEELMETLVTERDIFDLKQLVVGTPVINETRPGFINGAVNIEQFQKRGSLVDKSLYRPKR
jgi:hypothetical protein